MKSIIRPIAALLAIAGSLPFCSSAAIVPAPLEITSGDSIFTFGEYTTVSCGADSIADVFEVLAPRLQDAAGTRFVTVSDNGASIQFIMDSTISPEGYSIDVTPEGIVSKASTRAGHFYALQTLMQMLPVDSYGNPASIQTVSVSDSPRFGWRGFMLDEGRHFFGKDEVKRVLDMMATYKMNRFHWHLTDDQGWRLEIPEYPRLAEVGGTRPSVRLGWGREYRCDSIPYTGFYTHDDIREVVKYAADRFIEIVPEVDMPGHMQAAVAAYPEILACDPEASHEVWCSQGISDDVVNVANPEALKMSKVIIDNLIELFPYPYIHLGGDECPEDKWKDNKACRSRLESIGSDNYRDLQTDFYKQLADYLASKVPESHRKLIFWNEVLHGNTDMLPEDAVIMAWVGAEQAAKEAAAKGFATILTPQIPYYINRRQSDAVTEPMSQGNGSETLEAVYGYEPMRNVPDSLQGKYLGVQANFWTEYVLDAPTLEYLMMPRLAAVAEAAWTSGGERDYQDFRSRMVSHKPMFRARGWQFCPNDLAD